MQIGVLSRIFVAWLPRRLKNFHPIFKPQSKCRWTCFYAISWPIFKFWGKIDQTENGKDKLQKVLDQADMLFNALSFEILEKYLRDKQNTTFGNDVELTWRLARCLLERYKQSKPGDKKLILSEAMEIVEKSRILQQENAQIQKWYAIILMELAKSQSFFHRARSAHVVFEELRKAVELNPHDPTCLCYCGTWLYEIADMPAYQKRIFSLLNSQFSEASFKDAFEYFLSANQLNSDGSCQISCMLAKTFLKLGDERNARQFLVDAVNFTVKTTDDKQAHDEAFKLLCHFM